MMDVQIRHDAAGRKYVATKEGEDVGELVYRDTGNVRTFTHTGVPVAHRGQGIAGRLVERAMDDARAERTMKVVPACSYVDAWIRRHPEYADLAV